MHDRDALVEGPARLCQELLTERGQLLGQLLGEREQALAQLAKLSADPKHLLAQAALERALAKAEQQIGLLRYGVWA